MTGSKLRFYGMIALGLLLVGWFVALLFQNNDQPAVVTDAGHCPVCGKELPAGAFSAEDCPYCLLKNGGTRGGGGFGNVERPRLLVPAILITLFVVLVATHLVLFLRSRKRDVEGEEDLWYFRCPKCHRKLRFRISQAGRAGRCPTCRKPVLFPASSDPTLAEA